MPTFANTSSAAMAHPGGHQPPSLTTNPTLLRREDLEAALRQSQLDLGLAMARIQESEAEIANLKMSIGRKKGADKNSESAKLAATICRLGKNHCVFFSLFVPGTAYQLPIPTFVHNSLARYASEENIEEGPTSELYSSVPQNLHGMMAKTASFAAIFSKGVSEERSYAIDRVRKCANQIFSIPDENLFKINKDQPHLRSGHPRVRFLIGLLDSSPDEEEEEYKEYPPILFHDDNTDRPRGLFLNQSLFMIALIVIYGENSINCSSSNPPILKNTSPFFPAEGMSLEPTAGLISFCCTLALFVLSDDAKWPSSGVGALSGIDYIATQERFKRLLIESGQASFITRIFTAWQAGVFPKKVSNTGSQRQANLDDNRDRLQEGIAAMRARMQEDAESSEDEEDDDLEDVFLQPVPPRPPIRAQQPRPPVPQIIMDLGDDEDNLISDDGDDEDDGQDLGDGDLSGADDEDGEDYGKDEGDAEDNGKGRGDDGGNGLQHCQRAKDQRNTAVVGGSAPQGAPINTLVAGHSPAELLMGRLSLRDGPEEIRALAQGHAPRAQLNGPPTIPSVPAARLQDFGLSRILEADAELAEEEESTAREHMMRYRIPVEQSPRRRKRHSDDGSDNDQASPLKAGPGSSQRPAWMQPKPLTAFTLSGAIPNPPNSSFVTSTPKAAKPRPKPKPKQKASNVEPDAPLDVNAAPNLLDFVEASAANPVKKPMATTKGGKAKTASSGTAANGAGFSSPMPTAHISASDPSGTTAPAASKPAATTTSTPAQQNPEPAPASKQSAGSKKKKPVPTKEPIAAEVQPAGFSGAEATSDHSKAPAAKGGKKKKANAIADAPAAIPSTEESEALPTGAAPPKKRNTRAKKDKAAALVEATGLMEAAGIEEAPQGVVADGPCHARRSLTKARAVQG